MKKFKNAEKAFEYYYDLINSTGEQTTNTKRLQNVIFEIENPTERLINTSYRNWNENYAIREMEWYLSQNRSVEEIKKYAKIWDKMHNGDNIVNSNYGYQLNRNNQFDKIINLLKNNKETRRAVLTIYDAKEVDEYAIDTPCTLNLCFDIFNDKLNMTVLMRSNDLWYGFCNDQYCFSTYQEMIAEELNLNVGWYCHYVFDLHLYNQFLSKNI